MRLSIASRVPESGAVAVSRITGLGLLKVCICLLVVSALGAAAQTATPVNVPTWRYDNTHAGANTQETVLTPANVNTNSFGKLFSLAVDGYVYAQPLYVSGIVMADGLVHNVIYIATQHDSVYAFDADTNGGNNAQPLWKASMLDAAHGAAAGATTVPNTDVGTQDIVPEIGITSTPVYSFASNTIYVVAKSKENGGYVQRIHALNMKTGAEQLNSPSSISATVPGTGNGSTGGQLTFSPLWQMNRVALDLFNGYLYIVFGSHGDNGPWHGWVMAYNATTLQQTGVICLSPKGYGNGVWESGAGSAIDTVNTTGRMFLSAGNGSFTNYPPLSNNVDYANSILRLDLGNGTLTVGSAFTPFNQAALTNGDVDQGSGGELMLPDQPGPHPHELLQAGKEGRILLLDRDNLGGYAPGGSSNTNIIQDIPKQIGGLWSTPAYWNGHVYIWGSGDALKRFDLTNGLLSTTPVSSSATKAAFPGASAVISSNGTENGIVWAVRTDGYNSNGSAILYAFDANNAIDPLYESDTNSTRDDAGPATKFVVPVVTNGKVYVGAVRQVDVYGLLNGAQQAAPPVITPNGGTFIDPQQISITSSTPNSAIYYTTDGSIPTTAATLYTGPFTISTGMTIRATASAQGYLQSTSSATFTFVTQTPAPVFTPAPGSYTTAQVVTLSDSIAGAVIHYTTDGSTPTVNSPTYTGPITVNSTKTLSAMATSGMTPSNVTAGNYTIQFSGTGINFGSGFASVAGLTLNGSAVNSDDSRLQLTNGAMYESGSVFYNATMNIQSFTNDFSFQVSNPVADGFTFTIQASGLKALGANGAGLGYGAPVAGGTGGIPKSVAIKFDLYSNQGEGGNSTGIYTGGASPTIPSIDLTPSGINLHSGDSMNVHMVYDGTTLSMTITDPITGKTFSQNFAIDIPQAVGGNAAYVGFTGGSGGLTASQKILSWTFVSNAAVATQTPAISPTGGSFTTAQTVSLSSATSGALIYYTVDGSTPTTASPVYSGPLTVSSGSVTIAALAVASGYSPSAVNAATFVILPPAAATPTFSPSAGTYVGAQTVAISDATSGATIYYTTNGTTPTPSSTIYSGPITVSASQTIKAIAIASGFSASQIGSAPYVIQATGQTINFGSGFTSSTGLALNGNAHIYTTARALQLTDGLTYESGTAWATTPANVSAFTTDFVFQMKNPVADGFTFAIQSNGVTAKGVSGGSLGYATIPNSVALKFDINNNAGEGKNSIGVYTGGAQPMVPFTDLTGSGIVLTSGDTFQVHLVYNGTVLQVTITDTNTAATTTKSFPVNIPGALGTSQGYVGFTGGTGGLTVTTNILSWTFTSANQPVAAEPTFSPAPGTYLDSVQVSLSSLTPAATIYYTMDGSQPGHTSAVYSSPIQVSGNSLTIKAFASAANLSDSPIVTGSYIIQRSPASTPAFSPSAGTYVGTQTVAISDATSGATIYYTTNGTTPTASSTIYSGPITVPASQTIKAIAIASGFSASQVGSAPYVIQATGQTINFGSGFTSSTGLALNGNAHIYTTARALQLTDGLTYESGTAWATTPANVSAFTTDFVFQMKNPVADGFTFAIQSNGLTAKGVSGGSLGYATIPNSVALKFDINNNAGEGKNSIGVYTGGAQPMVPFTDLTGSGIVLTSGDTFQVHLVYNGTVLQVSITDTNTAATTTKSFPVNIPGALGTSQGYVGFTGSTGGLAVTTNILSWTFTSANQPVAATPIFSLSAGTYLGAQTVAISDATPAATIYYTINGTTPTTSSSVYSGPINVAATETIKAIAVASGFSASPVGSVAYVIQPAGQPINLSSGFASSTGLALNGNAHLNTTINALQLTDGLTYESGTAWATTPVNVSAFTTDFTFQMKNPVADGFTFAIQNNGLTAKGVSGGSLGYATIPNSVALKFDINNNAGEGRNSIGVYTGGAQPMVPFTDLTGSGIVLTSGDTFKVHLVYNGTVLQVSITDTNTSKSYTTTFPVNIPGALGANQGYVGFTGGTGGLTVTTNILSWTFTPAT